MTWERMRKMQYATLNHVVKLMDIRSDLPRIAETILLVQVVAMMIQVFLHVRSLALEMFVDPDIFIS